MTKVISPKKLIEVALPLDEINSACAHEKMPGIGPHPRGIHLWWARRPLAAARAIIFAQMVNDPSETVQGDKRLRETKLKIQKERENLFDIIRELVKWENTNNEDVLNRAREAIKDSWRFTCELNKKHPQADELFNPGKLPGFHDPFAGGGAIPLEAQRLGLESYASDLNPVAVMINKAMIEIPPKFSGQIPVGPIPNKDKSNSKKSNRDAFEEWTGVRGLSEDIRRYGYWLRDEVYNQIGDFYPQVKITDEMVHRQPNLKAYVGKSLKVISWIWARTVKSPSPAFKEIEVPLVKSFVLSNKKNKYAWVKPNIDNTGYYFSIETDVPPESAKSGTKSARGANFTCLLSGSPIPGDYIKSEGKAGRLGLKLLAVVLEGVRERVYIEPQEGMEQLALSANPSWIPETLLAPDKRALWTPPYGLDTYGKLFTPRQLLSLNAFSDLIPTVKNKIISDMQESGAIDDGKGLSIGGNKATAYAEAICVYLSFCIDRCADFNNSLTGWRPGNEKIMYLFARQAIPMAWDFGEANIMEDVVGGFTTNLEYQVKCLQKVHGDGEGFVSQDDAANQSVSCNKVISTDPPYYDNIGYADLSDFFYVWMRKNLRAFYPNLFATMAVPKAEELIAAPYRHGGAEAAESFFLNGMTSAIGNLASKGHPAFPTTIYYAFKQSETKGDSTSSAGWETFLEAVIRSGFSIDGTWPMRSEQSSRMIGVGKNALASSVVLVCRKRDSHAETVSRRHFQRELREEMPEALEAMIGGSNGASPIAPVDLAQAAIGPGMAIFSKYEAVLNQDGSQMSVHDALILINRAITDYLNPDSGNFDNDTLFCDSWFSQYGWGQGQFGEADTLARAKGTSVDGVRDAGVIESGGGKVRLLKWSEYPTDWDPKGDSRIPVWEACHQMIRVLNQKGEAEAGALLARMPDLGEQVRQLAYHLYTLCERKKWAEEARAYNELIGSWHAIVTASNEVGHRGEQHGLDFDF
ncbi:DUF1156 domain-containing protein [Vibrio cholerae]|nr:DUF1156 domain-containing protein [Vibrio cholerae]EKG0003987.1 DUF1156 domain-containing protein [Vibrio cholerae]